jgi:hypothetical protein
LLVDPLGNLAGMAIRRRACCEFDEKDWTLTIVLGAMAVESHLVFLFMKWKRAHLILKRNATVSDDEGWETEWRDVFSIAARFDKLSNFLTGQSFDSFLASRPDLLAHAQYVTAPSEPKDFFVKELFYRRNHILHSGNINSTGAEAELCLKLSLTLWAILDAMDYHQRKLVGLG